MQNKIRENLQQLQRAVVKTFKGKEKEEPFNNIEEEPIDSKSTSSKSTSSESTSTLAPIPRNNQWVLRTNDAEQRKAIKNYKIKNNIGTSDQLLKESDHTISSVMNLKTLTEKVSVPNNFSKNTIVPLQYIKDTEDPKYSPRNYKHEDVTVVNNLGTNSPIVLPGQINSRNLTTTLNRPKAKDVVPTLNLKKAQQRRRSSSSNESVSSPRLLQLENTNIKTTTTVTNKR